MRAVRIWQHGEMSHKGRYRWPRIGSRHIGSVTRRRAATQAQPVPAQLHATPLFYEASLPPYTVQAPSSADAHVNSAATLAVAEPPDFSERHALCTRAPLGVIFVERDRLATLRTVLEK